MPTCDVAANRYGNVRMTGFGFSAASRYQPRVRGSYGGDCLVNVPICCASLSKNSHDCTRARLSAEGKLYTCLFASRGHDLRALVRDESISDADLDERLRGLWRMRADRYSELRTQGTPVDLPRVEMSHIGG